MKKIIVHDLNKLRVIYPKQSFTSNVLYPQSQAELVALGAMLAHWGISYSIKERLYKGDNHVA